MTSALWSLANFFSALAGSTGSPLPPEGFDWVREGIGPGDAVGLLGPGTQTCDVSDCSHAGIPFDVDPHLP